MRSRRAHKNQISAYQWYLSSEKSQSSQLVVGFFSLVLGICIATLTLYVLPVDVSSLEKAKQLGIISRTILDGYPKHLEIPYYIIGACISLFFGMAIFCSATFFLSRKTSVEPPLPDTLPDYSKEEPKRGLGLFRWLCLALALFLVTFNKRFIYQNWYWGDWGFFFEEGIYLRWIHEMLNGKVLYKDVYYYGGPFLIWPQYWLMKLIGPSIALNRLYVYCCNFAGYLLVIAVLRQMVSRKLLVLAGTALVVYLYYPLFPGVHQTLGRFAVSLLPLYLLYLFFFKKKILYLLTCGISAAFALFSSQELGLASLAAIAAMLAVYHYREHDAKGFVRHAAIIGLGVSTLTAPVLIYFFSHDALSNLFEAFIIIPRYYSMGVWGFHFPNIFLYLRHPDNLGYDLSELLLAYWPILFYIASVFFFLIQFLRRTFSNRLILAFGISLMGAIIFQRAFGIYSLFKINNVIYPIILLGFGYLDMIWSRIPVLRKEWESPGRKMEAVAFVILFLYIFSGITGFVGPRGFLLGLTPCTYSRLNLDSSPLFLPLSIPGAERIQLPPKEALEVKRTVEYIKTNCPQGEAIYVFPFAPIYYFLTDRESPTRYPVPYVITRALREETVQQLQRKNVKYVILLLPSSPVLGVPTEQQFPEIYDYIRSHYEFEKKFGDVDILRLKE